MRRTLTALVALLLMSHTVAVAVAQPTSGHQHAAIDEPASTLQMTGPTVDVGELNERCQKDGIETKVASLVDRTVREKLTPEQTQRIAAHILDQIQSSDISQMTTSVDGFEITRADETTETVSGDEQSGITYPVGENGQTNTLTYAQLWLVLTYLDNHCPDESNASDSDARSEQQQTENSRDTDTDEKADNDRSDTETDEKQTDDENDIKPPTEPTPEGPARDFYPDGPGLLPPPGHDPLDSDLAKKLPPLPTDGFAGEDGTLSSGGIDIWDSEDESSDEASGNDKDVSDEDKTERPASENCEHDGR